MARAACLGWGILFAPGWGQGGWQDLGRPWSATLTAFAACSSSQGAFLLAGSRGGRIFRSTDDGATWTQTPARMETEAKGFLDLGGGAILAWAGVIPSPLWDCWSPDCGDPTRPGGLFRSADDGRSWARVGPEHGITAVAPLGPHLVATGRTELYRSADRGATGQRLAQTGTAGIGMDRMDGAGTVLVGSAWGSFSRVVLSGDTAHWEVSPGGYGAGDFLGYHRGLLYAYRLPPAPSSGEQPRLMRSLNGNVWQAVSTRRLQHMAASGNRLLGLYLDTLFTSADGGATWTVAEAGILEGREHRFLAATGDRVYLGGSAAKGLLRRESGRWEWLCAGMHDMPPGPILSTDAELLHADPNLGLATRSLTQAGWTTPLIGGQPIRTATALATLGRTALAASSWLAYRTDDLDVVRRLGPDAWAPDSALGFRAAATGRGWMALFRDGRNILLCEGGSTAACQEGAIQDLPVESFISFGFTTVYANRFRAMAAAGDSLAVALDSLYLSTDRGATFRNLGPVGYNPKWLAFHGGELFAGAQTPVDAAGNNLLRLDPSSGTLVPHVFPGTGAAMDIRGLASSARGDAYLAASRGVFRWDPLSRTWKDISQGLPSRDVTGITFQDQVCVAALESGQLLSTLAYTIGTRPGRARAARAPTRRPGLQPRFADPAGAWRRLDGRAAEAPGPAPR